MDKNSIGKEIVDAVIAVQRETVSWSEAHRHETRLPAELRRGVDEKRSHANSQWSSRLRNILAILAARREKNIRTNPPGVHRFAAPLKGDVGFKQMVKQSIPTKMFAWLACITGSVGTVVYIIALLTAVWVFVPNQNQRPVLVVGFLAYGLVYSVAILLTGISIMRRYKHALLLVVAVTLWHFVNHAIWTRMYHMHLIVYSHRHVLALLFLAWMILRRCELRKEETQPESGGEA